MDLERSRDNRDTAALVRTICDHFPIVANVHLSGIRDEPALRGARG